MEVCKTDIKQIVRYLRFGADHLDTDSSTRKQNSARLMRLMARKLEKKAKNQAQQNNYDKKESSHQ